MTALETTSLEGAAAASGDRDIPPRGRASICDALFLVAVVSLSFAPYLSRLAFSSDDWILLAVLHQSDQSLSGMWNAQHEHSATLRYRPTQILQYAALFRAFGLNPTGYHVVNGAVLAAVAVLLYLVLREYGVQRAIAVAASSVYILLPNYSADRFWFAACVYPLTTALLLLGIYAFLRAVRGGMRWTMLGLVCVAAALLGVEIVLPLVVAWPAALWLRLRQQSSAWQFRRPALGNLILLVAGPLVVVVLVFLFKTDAGATGGTTVPGLRHVVLLAVGALAVNFGSFGVLLPHTTSWALSQLSWFHNAFAICVAAAAFVYLYFISHGAQRPPRHTWMRIGCAGAAIFVLGTAIFLITPRVAYWSLGVSNRVWIIAAIGTALVLISVCGCLSAWLCRWMPFAGVFSGLVAALCFSGFVVNSALSQFWVDASRQQIDVLNDIRRALPAVQPGTTVILHGVCPYVGPGIVFESSWDLAGALQIMYGDPSLRADVTTGEIGIAEEGLLTRLYSKSYFYGYGENLVLFDRRTQAITRLTHADAARQHLSAGTACPDGFAGGGAVFLPVDAWYAKGFRPPW